MHLFATVTAEQVLEGGKKAYFQKQTETLPKQTEPNRSAATVVR